MISTCRMKFRAGCRTGRPMRVKWIAVRASQRIVTAETTAAITHSIYQSNLTPISNVFVIYLHSLAVLLIARTVARPLSKSNGEAKVNIYIFPLEGIHTRIRGIRSRRVASSVRTCTAAMVVAGLSSTLFDNGNHDDCGNGGNRSLSAFIVREHS